MGLKNETKEYDFFQENDWYIESDSQINVEPIEEEAGVSSPVQ